jgi:hypothetical protein
MLKGGAIDFLAKPATPVAASDPNASEITWWEQSLSMKGWDVNQPVDPNGDTKYLFIPTGAQGVSSFQVFYYRIYGAGGNGQFYFDCQLY